MCAGYCDIELQETRIFYRNNFSVAAFFCTGKYECETLGFLGFVDSEWEMGDLTLDFYGAGSAAARLAGPQRFVATHIKPGVKSCITTP